MTAGGSSSPNASAVAELKAAFDKHRQMNWVLGGLMIVSILGAIPAWAGVGMAVGLLWGAIAFAGCLIIFFIALVAMMVQAEKKSARAKEEVREIENRHGLTPQQSLELIWPEGYRLPDNERPSFFKPFIDAVWGEKSYEQAEEQARIAILAKYNIKDKSASLPAPVYLAHFACGYCHKPVIFKRGEKIVCGSCQRKLQLRSLVKCPKCKVSPELAEDLAGGVAGELIGTAVGGAAGTMIGKAMAGQMTTVYACPHCQHRFGMELLVETDLEMPAR
jgi:hypothetical protein